jgi:excisionase family DNA binding protein
MTTQLDPAAATKRSQLLKVSDVAQLLNVKPRTIYEMVTQHCIPYRKPPGSNILRFDIDEIVAWTKAKTAR